MEVKHCAACEGGNIKALPDEEVMSRLANKADWHYDSSKKRISKAFKFKGYNNYVQFVLSI